MESELSDREKTIYDALSSEPIHIETLLHRSKMPIELLSGTLVMLELRGLVKRQIGDWYSLLPPPSPPGPVHACPLNEKSKLTIGSFIEFVHSTFSGISRKYLQNYLGWYWCLVDKKRWKPGALLNECSGSPRTSLKEILEYVSPLLVKFSPVPIN